ncbi:sortase [Nocardioides pantholopis]|uniref:sortase n=1 Tax=Nocardioides pantholopis TaxID=2483798 RepID=UPI000FD8FD9B|nr:sortase [Nocardioides pantholopis]
MRRLLAALIVLAAILAVPVGHVAVTGLQTSRAQTELLEQLEQLEADGTQAAAGTAGAAGGQAAASTRNRPSPVAAGVEHGRPLAVLEIPRLGKSWRWAVLEGTEDDVIADGIGHYAGTPLPGAAGNVALAGHRAGHGSPFLDFEELRPGDEVRITQGTSTWTYRLTTSPRKVDNDADWVLDPLPGHQLTLTTCWPKYGSLARLYVRGELVGPRSAPAT